MSVHLINLVKVDDELDGSVCVRQEMYTGLADRTARVNAFVADCREESRRRHIDRLPMDLDGLPDPQEEEDDACYADEDWFLHSLISDDDIVADWAQEQMEAGEAPPPKRAGEPQEGPPPKKCRMEAEPLSATKTGLTRVITQWPSARTVVRDMACMFPHSEARKQEVGEMEHARDCRIGRAAVKLIDRATPNNVLAYPTSNAHVFAYFWPRGLSVREYYDGLTHGMEKAMEKTYFTAH